MPSNLDLIEKYFPTGTTEGERHILQMAFVPAEEYAGIITPPPYSPRILVGKKGSGKSAVLEFSQRVMNTAGIPVLFLRPKHFEGINFKDNGSVGEHTSMAYNLLVKTISSQIGKQFENVLLNEKDRLLYQSAIESGDTKKDIVTRLLSFIPKIAKTVVDIDLSSLSDFGQVAPVKRLADALKTNIEMSGKGFYLFVDDIDQIASPSQSGHLNRIWGVLLAIRELTQEVMQLRCVITLREEVWRRLSHDKAGQRDQTDHFTSLLMFLNPDNVHIASIIERRLFLARRELGIKGGGGPYEVFFEGKSAKMPTSNKLRSWKDLIVLRSRERPRDAIQLVNALAKDAKKKRQSKITEISLRDVMPIFSRQRVTFLSQEVEEECPQMNEIIRSLAEIEYDEGAFKAGTELFRSHISTLPSRFSIRIHGRQMRPDDPTAVFEIWRFLFENGVVNARISDTRESDGFRHIKPRDDPSLISESRWNDMQKIIWEVYPAYRDFILEVRAEKRSSIGLAR